MKPTGSDIPAAKPSDESGYDFSRLSDLQSCPPPSAGPKEGTFYAFHASHPPDQADFRTAAQRGVYAGGDECQRRSNSVFSDLSAINGLRADLRKRGRGLICRYISAGKIRRDSGVVSQGNGPHHSFWVCGKTSMRAIFTELVQ